MNALAQAKTDQSTNLTPTPKHHQNLAFNDFFVGVNEHDLKRPEFQNLKPMVRLCYVYLNLFTQDGDQFKKRHTYQNRNYDLPDGTLYSNNSLKPRLANLLGVTESTVSDYLRDLCEANFIQHDPKWKKIGGQIRYQIVRFQDEEVTANYLKKIHKAPIRGQKTLGISQQVDQKSVNTDIPLSIDPKAIDNSSSSLNRSNPQLPIPGSELEPQEPINPYFKISQLWKEKTKRVPRAGGPAFVVDFLTRFNLSEVQAEKVLLRAIPNFDYHHPDGSFINHITWIANDTRSYDGTTGDWLRKEIEAEGGKIPQAKAKLDNSTATANQLTQSEKEQYQADRVREREKSRAMLGKMARKTQLPKDFNPIPYRLREDQ
jgi:hypothetical protein